MTSFKKYFFYRFKHTLLRLLVLCALCLLVVIGGMVSEGKYYSPSILTTVLGVLCIVVPALELSGYKNRRNLDQLFSLPVSRKKQALSLYLNGLVQTIVAYTVCFIAVIIHMAVNLNKGGLGYLTAYYFLSLIVGSLVYSVFIFVFNQANTVIDGVICEILAAYALFFAAYAVRLAIGIDYSVYRPSYTAFSPLGSDGIYRIVEKSSFVIPVQSVVMCIVWGLIGIACIFGYFYTFERTRVENIGGISNSIIGYRLFIPIWAYSLLIMTGGLLAVFVYISMLIGYIIFRRGVRFKKEDYLSIIFSLPFLCLGIILF